MEAKEESGGGVAGAEVGLPLGPGGSEGQDPRRVAASYVTLPVKSSKG